MRTGTHEHAIPGFGHSLHRTRSQNRGKEERILRPHSEHTSNLDGLSRGAVTSLVLKSGLMSTQSLDLDTADVWSRRALTLSNMAAEQLLLGSGSDASRFFSGLPDEAVESVSISSVWRRSHQGALKAKSCQTEAVLRDEAGVQTSSTASSSTQTETEPARQQNHDEPEPTGLVDFLLKTEDLIIRELVKNTRSHAFDGFQTNRDDQNRLVSCLHRLQHPGAKDSRLHVSSVSWSCTGSIIACSYSRIDDGNWSNQRSWVCLWNLDRRNLNPTQADLVLDVPAAVTSLSCHPTRPALIAGGLFSGEVVVWDTSRTQDPVLAQTGMSADSHRDPVYQVSWVPLQKKGEFGVLSSGSEGRVLVWTVDSDHNRLVLNAAYSLRNQQLPHSAGSKVRGSGTVGVSALALSPWDPDIFLVGSEGGLLLRCSFSSQVLAAAPPKDQSVAPRAPAVFSFRTTSGPVHSIHCSPFHRNLFVSAGTDGLARIHSLLQANPLLSIQVSDSYVFHVEWSPWRPLVFAAATGRGEVQIFDLARRSLRPAATMVTGGSGWAATCLAFNHQNPRLVAVGNSDGSVSVWQLSSDLIDQNPMEISQLEQLANKVAE